MKLLVEWGADSAILQPERTYTVGRDQSCDIALDNSRVSKTHLRLAWEDGSWKATDLESTNGTFLNSKLSRVTKINDSKALHLGGVNNVVLKLTPLTGAQSAKSKVTKHILEKINNKEIETEEEWKLNVFKPEEDIKKYFEQFKYNKK